MKNFIALADAMIAGAELILPLVKRIIEMVSPGVAHAERGIMRA